MKISEIRELSIEKLRSELTATLREQFSLRMQQATKQLVQTHRLKLVKQKIAQMYTILQQKTGQTS